LPTALAQCHWPPTADGRCEGHSKAWEVHCGSSSRAALGVHIIISLLQAAAGGRSHGGLVERRREPLPVAAAPVGRRPPRGCSGRPRDPELTVLAFHQQRATTGSLAAAVR
jgi:hypothetical protein